MGNYVGRIIVTHETAGSADEPIIVKADEGLGSVTIDGAGAMITWKFEGSSRSMYQVEHDELFASIRSGEPINNGYYMSVSTMMAIAGRMVAYTGETKTWEELLNSKLDLSPPAYDWTDLPVPEVAVPGKTKFV